MINSCKEADWFKFSRSRSLQYALLVFGALFVADLSYNDSTSHRQATPCAAQQLFIEIFQGADHQAVHATLEEGVGCNTNADEQPLQASEI